MGPQWQQTAVADGVFSASWQMPGQTPAWGQPQMNWVPGSFFNQQEAGQQNQAVPAQWFSQEQIMKMNWGINQQLFNQSVWGKQAPANNWEQINWGQSFENQQQQAVEEVQKENKWQEFTMEEMATLVAQKMYEMQKADAPKAVISWSESFVRDSFKNAEQLPFFNKVQDLTPKQLADVIDQWKQSGMLWDEVEDVIGEDVLYKAQRMWLDPNTWQAKSKQESQQLSNYWDVNQALNNFQKNNWQNNASDYTQANWQMSEKNNNQQSQVTKPQINESTMEILATQKTQLSMKDLELEKAYEKIWELQKSQEWVNSFQSRLGQDLFEVKSAPVIEILKNVELFEKTQTQESKVGILNSIKWFLNSIGETEWNIDSIVGRLTNGQAGNLPIHNNQQAPQQQNNQSNNDIIRRLKNQSIG